MITDSRHKRGSVGKTITIQECRRIGETCHILQDAAEVIMYPCCEKLLCLGIGPKIKRNGKEVIYDLDDNHYSGMCSPSLDNNEVSKHLKDYE